MPRQRIDPVSTRLRARRLNLNLRPSRQVRPHRIEEGIGRARRLAEARPHGAEQR